MLREDFQPDSDVDVLVEFEQGHAPGLIRLEGMAIDLASILGDRCVDLNTPDTLSRYFRDRVMREAEVLYVRAG